MGSVQYMIVTFITVIIHQKTMNHIYTITRGDRKLKLPDNLAFIKYNTGELATENKSIISNLLKDQNREHTFS